MFCRRTRVRAFTLVELLVVISITTLLVAILMPALAEARKASLRATCLSDRRQLNISSFMYGNDHSDRVPSDTNLANWQAGDRTPVATLSWGNDTAWQLAYTPVVTPQIYPLGSLMMRQYIGAPNILYCNDFPRLSLFTTATAGGWSASTIFMDTPANAAGWGTLTSGRSNISFSRGMTTVAHYLYAERGNTATNIPNLRFSQIAEQWPINNTFGQKFTAFQYSCAFLAWGPYFAGHDGKYLPTVFIDGSGRTINMVTMKSRYAATLGAFPRNNGSPNFSNMQVWARQKNDDTRPGGN